MERLKSCGESGYKRRKTQGDEVRQAVRTPAEEDRRKDQQVSLIQITMPFTSAKQRAYLWAKEPAVAKRWTKKYGSKIRPKKKKK